MGAAKTSFDRLPGSDVALARNPANGRFDLQFDDTNNFMFDDTRAHAVLSLLYERKGQYSADPTGQRGSYLYAVKEDRKATPSQLQGYAEEALTVLVEQGKIVPPNGQTKIIVTPNRVQPGRIDLNIVYSTPTGGVVTTRATLTY